MLVGYNCTISCCTRFIMSNFYDFLLLTLKCLEAMEILLSKKRGGVEIVLLLNSNKFQKNGEYSAWKNWSYLQGRLIPWKRWCRIPACRLPYPCLYLYLGIKTSSRLAHYLGLKLDEPGCVMLLMVRICSTGSDNNVNHLCCFSRA